jgi:hypothetical protein
LLGFGLKAFPREGRDRGEQRRTLVARQAQRRGKLFDRGAIRPRLARFEALDGALTQASPLGQHRLAEARREPMRPEQATYGCGPAGVEGLIPVRHLLLAFSVHHLAGRRALL